MDNNPGESTSESAAWLKAAQQDPEATWDFLKQTQQPMANVEKAIEDAKAKDFVVGAKVRLKGVEEIGEVVGYNTANSGFYSGDRYPIIVRFERGKFEYGVESLELVSKRGSIKKVLKAS